MIQKIQNGEYVKAQDGGLENVDYLDELLQNVFFHLTVQRGDFYPDKNFGSNLRRLAGVNEAMALAYARQAVDHLDGVYIKNCVYEDNGFNFCIMLNDEERQVRVSYENI